MARDKITADDVVRELLRAAGSDPFRQRVRVTGASSPTGGAGPAAPPTPLPGGGGGMANPMTTAGDLIVGGTAGAPTRLGKGAEGEVLTVVGGLLAWTAPTGGGGGASALDDLTDVDTSTVPPVAGGLLVWNGSQWVPAAPTAALLADFDDAARAAVGPFALAWNLDEGGVPAVGAKAVFVLPAAAEIVDWALYADTAGDVTLDVQRATHSTYPTFTSLVGAGTKPALAASQKATMTSLGGWTTALAARDLVTIAVEAAVDLAFVHFSLFMERV